MKYTHTCYPKFASKTTSINSDKSLVLKQFGIIYPCREETTDVFTLLEVKAII